MKTFVKESPNSSVAKPQSWQRLVVLTGVCGALVTPALAGNGCNDSIAAQCTFIANIGFDPCHYTGLITGYKEVTASCQQYRRPDMRQYLKMNAWGNPTDLCEQSNSACNES
jgi:hypothetical protein